MKRILYIVIAAFVVLFLIAAPAVIPAGIHKSSRSMRQEELKKNYKGNLEVWHVVSFKTGGTSGISHLKSLASKFERNNPYVFLRVTGMTVKEAEERIINGELPDVISYPLGAIEDATFKKTDILKEDTLVNGLRSCASENGVPYMADFYVVLINEGMLSDAGLMLTFEERISKEDFNCVLNDAGGRVSFSDIAGTFSFNALSGLIEDGTIVHPTLGKESFIREESAIHICPYSEYQAILADKDGANINMSARLIGEYTDLVQIMGVVHCEDEAKRSMCEDFIKSVISLRSQKKLEGLKMLPVINIEEIYEGEMLIKSAYMDLNMSAMVPAGDKLNAAVKKGDVWNDFLKKAPQGNWEFSGMCGFFSG